MYRKDIEMKGLEEFLRKANRNTYAADGERSPATRLGSEDLEFCDGDWVYHDTYFGSARFIGEEIVYYKGVPVWGMNYYGYIVRQGILPKAVYTFLKQALLQESGDVIPVRGPKVFSVNALTYRNTVSGSLENFEGREEIDMDGACVYRARYHGGNIVDP